MAVWLLFSIRKSLPGRHRLYHREPKGYVICGRIVPVVSFEFRYCPNQVLRPSTKLETLMQPEMSYERGYCRPECTKCSEVCPAGAILKLTPADKSATQIGHAVWVEKNCVPLRDKVECGNCARHCPTGAITMVPSDADDADSLKIPVVNVERCIGCGACENLCPARPFSAIYVEGHEQHRTI